MKMTVQRFGEKLVISAQGRIDTTTAVDYGTKINDFLDDSETEIKELVLNFEGIDYISSIGLRVILELQKRINDSGSLKIINVAPGVMEVFEMTGFTNVLTIE